MNRYILADLKELGFALRYPGVVPPFFKPSGDARPSLDCMLCRYCEEIYDYNQMVDCAFCYDSALGCTNCLTKLKYIPGKVNEWVQLWHKLVHLDKLSLKPIVVVYPDDDDACMQCIYDGMDGCDRKYD